MVAFVPTMDPYRSTTPTPIATVVSRLRKHEQQADRQPVKAHTSAGSDGIVEIRDNTFAIRTPEGIYPTTLAGICDLAGMVGVSRAGIKDHVELEAYEPLADLINTACIKRSRDVVINTTMTRRRGFSERVVDSVVSESYQLFLHSNALATLLGEVDEDAHVVDFSLDERLMRARISAEAFEIGKRIVAIDVRNSMTRKSSLVFTAADFNPICTNGVVIYYAKHGHVAYRHTRNMLSTVTDGSASTPALSEALPRMIEAAGMGINLDESLKSVPVVWSKANVDSDVEYATPLEAFVNSREGLTKELRKLGTALPAPKEMKPFVIEGLTHETTAAHGSASSLVNAMTWAAHASGVGLSQRQQAEEAAGRLLQEIAEWRKGREKIAILRDGTLERVA